MDVDRIELRILPAHGALGPTRFLVRVLFRAVRTTVTDVSHPPALDAVHPPILVGNTVATNRPVQSRVDRHRVL